MRPRRTTAALATATVAVTLTALGVAPTAASAAPSDLFISEYVEGSSNNKAIELFNGTGAAGRPDRRRVPAPALLQRLHHGHHHRVDRDAWPPGTSFVFASASAAPAILAQADQTTGASLFNGDDAIVLRRGTHRARLDRSGRRRPGHRVGHRASPARPTTHCAGCPP